MVESDEIIVPHVVLQIELDGRWIYVDPCFDEPLYRGGRAMGLNAFANLADIDWVSFAKNPYARNPLILSSDDGTVVFSC